MTKKFWQKRDSAEQENSEKKNKPPVYLARQLYGFYPNPPTTQKYDAENIPATMCRIM